MQMTDKIEIWSLPSFSNTRSVKINFSSLSLFSVFWLFSCSSFWGMKELTGGMVMVLEGRQVRFGLFIGGRDEIQWTFGFKWQPQIYWKTLKSETTLTSTVARPLSLIGPECLTVGPEVPNGQTLEAGQLDSDPRCLDLGPIEARLETLRLNSSLSYSKTFLFFVFPFHSFPIMIMMRKGNQPQVNQKNFLEFNVVKKCHPTKFVFLKTDEANNLAWRKMNL